MVELYAINTTFELGVTIGVIIDDTEEIVLQIMCGLIKNKKKSI